jgi:hypothetical protein
LRQNGSAQGGRAKEYVDISRPADAALGHFGQIPSGRPDDGRLDAAIYEFTT